MTSSFLMVFFMTSHGFSIKKPSKKPWKIHHWASTCHQGPRRPPSGGSSPSRSEGSGERSPRTPGPPWGRCNYGWYMMGIYIMYVYIYIYIYIHKGDVCIDILLMSTYSKNISEHTFCQPDIYIYIYFV